MISLFFIIVRIDLCIKIIDGYFFILIYLDHSNSHKDNNCLPFFFSLLVTSNNVMHQEKNNFLEQTSTSLVVQD